MVPSDEEIEQLPRCAKGPERQQEGRLVVRVGPLAPREVFHELGQGPRTDVVLLHRLVKVLAAQAKRRWRNPVRPDAQVRATAPWETSLPCRAPLP